MVSHLDRKLFRDLRRMTGQAVAVTLVIASGLAMLVMARSLIHSLDSTRAAYYEGHRFAEVFTSLKRAPNAIATRIASVTSMPSRPKRWYISSPTFVCRSWRAGRQCMNWTPGLPVRSTSAALRGRTSST